jgi:hypothetical protein
MLSTPKIQKDAASLANFPKLFVRLVHPKTVHALFRKHRANSAGAPSLLSVWQLVLSLVFHVLQSQGTLSAHVKQVSGKTASASALSQRRKKLTWGFFEALLTAILRPQADPYRHPDAFYKGLRLIGLDGSTWSVANTPQVKHQVRKAKSRRQRAAFPKLPMAALYELGLHNPLALAVGLSGQSCYSSR